MTEDQIDRVLEALGSIAERHDRECGLPTWKPEAREEMRAAVHAYAEEAVKKEREDCAKAVASLATNDWDRTGSEDGSFNQGIDEAVAAIRARTTD